MHVGRPPWTPFDSLSESTAFTCETDVVIETRHPTNPLNQSGYVHELLMDLSDNEVGEFIEYWTWQREQHKSDGQEFAAWKSSNLISAGRKEAARRGIAL